MMPIAFPAETNRVLETGLLRRDSLHEGRIGAEFERERRDEQLCLRRGGMATVQQSVFVQPGRVEHRGTDALDLRAGGDTGDVTRGFGSGATRSDCDGRRRRVRRL